MPFHSLPPLSRREFLRRSTMGGSAGLAALAFQLPFTGTALGAATESPIVATGAGKVRGVTADGVHIFKGVPYGAPTGGANRFKPPRPAAGWTGVREAIAYGPSAPQAGAAGAASSTDEDCLLLNLWSPGLGDGGRRPVMVWLHGGGFASGSGSSAWYDGSRLARRGDVVVVTLNHRLNAFGATYLGEIGGEEWAASGCVGSLDIVAALEWVRENVEAFGGDPSNVMIFGESGGGRKVSVLLAMPRASGLFHRAVIQSGTVMRIRGRDDATREAEMLIAALGLRNDQLHQLQKTPVELVLQAHRAILGQFRPHQHIVGTTASTPVLDGEILPAHPFEPTAPRPSIDVPVMFGWTRTEETLFRARSGMQPDLGEASLIEQVQARLGERGDAATVVAAYRAAHPAARPWDLLMLIATDHPRGTYPRTAAARKAALGRAPAFVYRFDWDMGGELKSPHALEIPFVFDNIDAPSRLYEVPSTPESHALAARVSAAWMAFARSGDPTTPGLPPWPAYEPPTRATMLLDDESRVVEDPERELRTTMEAVLELS